MMKVVYDPGASPTPVDRPTNPMVKSMCRLCMTTTGTTMKDLFTGGPSSFAKKLIEVFQFEVTSTDGFPPRICHRCSLQLNSAYTFKRRCLDSRKKIADIISWNRDHLCKREAKVERPVAPPALLGHRSAGATSRSFPHPPPPPNQTTVASSKRNSLNSINVRLEKQFPSSTDPFRGPQCDHYTIYDDTASSVAVDRCARSRGNDGATPVVCLSTGAESREEVSVEGKRSLGASTSRRRKEPADESADGTVAEGNVVTGDLVDANVDGTVNEDVKPYIVVSGEVLPCPSKSYPFSFVDVKEELPEMGAEELDALFPPSVEHKFSIPRPADHDYCVTLEPDGESDHAETSSPLHGRFGSFPRPMDDLPVGREERDSRSPVVCPRTTRKPRKNDLTRFKTCVEMPNVSYYLNCHSIRKLLKIPNARKPHKIITKIPRKTITKIPRREIPKVVKTKKVIASRSPAEIQASIVESIETTVNESRERAETAENGPCPGLDVVLAEFVSAESTADDPGLLEGGAGLGRDDIADLDLSLFSSEEFLAVEEDVEPQTVVAPEPKKAAKRSRKKTNENGVKTPRAKRPRRELVPTVKKKRGPKPLEKPEPKIHPCVHCGVSFARVLYLDTHLRYHCGPNKRENKCNLCGAIFDVGHKLSVHLKEAHPGGRNYTCEHCGRAFCWRTSMLYHVNKRHTRERVFLCSVCGKTFGRASELAVHVARHSNERPHKCTFCARTFAARDLLRLHLRVHSDETYFNCGHCDKKFKHKQVLVHHIYTHIGRRPYRCKYCRKRFGQMSDVTKHHRVHTGEHPYECAACGKSFTQRWYVRKHPCPERDRLASLRAEEERLASKHAEEELLASQRAEEELLTSKRADEELLASQHTEEELLISQRAEEELLASQRVGEELLASQLAREELPQSAEELLVSLHTEEELLALQHAEEGLSSSQRAGEELVASQCAEDGLLASQQAEEGLSSSQRAEEELLASQCAKDELPTAQSAEKELHASHRAEEKLFALQPANEEGLTLQPIVEEGLSSCGITAVEGLLPTRPSNDNGRPS